MGQLGGTQQGSTVLHAIMSHPGICDLDSHDVGFVISVHIQYHSPLACTMTFPNELQLCHHLLGDKHYSKSVGEGQMITIHPIQSGKRNRRDLRLARPTKYAFFPSTSAFRARSVPLNSALPCCLMTSFSTVIPVQKNDLNKTGEVRLMRSEESKEKA